jgi:hypothetical protein
MSNNELNLKDKRRNAKQMCLNEYGFMLQQLTGLEATEDDVDKSLKCHRKAGLRRV